MNRTIALFVALVMLLAHVLSIHTDARGLVAVAWDQAHVPFRLGRNLIYEGQLAWNPGMEAFESYPSVLWVLLCAVFERVSALMHGSVNVFAQTTGVLCALATTVVVSRVRPQRAAGLMAALILATSGAFAAAAVSGLETALYVWLLAWAFLAFERGRGWWMGFLLALAMLTRPETLLFVAGFAVLRGFGRPGSGVRPVAWLPFCVPLTTFALGAVARGLTSGNAWPPSFDPWLQADGAQLSAGYLTLKAFVLITIVPLLLVWPLLYLVRRKISPVGAHAAFFALLWMIAAAWRGGGALPFFEAFVPALPFLAIAAQEGLVVAFDAPSKLVRRTALACLALALGGSVLASKTPGDIGPLKTSAYYALSATPAPQVRLDYDEPLGRLALHEEIAHTNRLRKLGHYLRWELSEGASVLTPWPGSIGYISRRVVYDALGRAVPLVPTDRPRSWDRAERADMVATVLAGFDYIVPEIDLVDGQLSAQHLADQWRLHLDSRSEQPERTAELAAAFEQYELITVRCGVPDRSLVWSDLETMHLLRKRALGKRPQLLATLDGQRLVVGVRHNAETQLTDMHFELRSAAGVRASVRPTGELDNSAQAHARTRLLLYGSGQRTVELWNGSLPAVPKSNAQDSTDSTDRWVEARIQLRNPHADASASWGAASDELVIPLP